MKNIIYFLIFSSIIFSCRNEQNKVALEIASLDGKWIKGKTTYWARIEKNSSWSRIQATDTLRHSEYEKSTEFKLYVNNKLFVKKFIRINPLAEIKISESIKYSKEINNNIETTISLSYNYKNDSYFSCIIDSIGKKKKRNENKIKLDSMYKYAEKHGLYLCGTAANEILYEGIPEFAIPREINLDSTLLLMKKWKKQAYNTI